MLSFKEWIKEEAKKSKKKDKPQSSKDSRPNNFNVYQKETDITDKEVVTAISHYIPEPQ